MKTVHSDVGILEAWEANAKPWTHAVRDGRITSRVQVTDAAILAAIFRSPVGTLLDVGCGEGWLTRAVAKTGVEATGIDAVAPLIESARSAGGGEFELTSYEALADGAFDAAWLAHFDAVVCNFSLLGDRATSDLIGHAARWLAPGGRLIVQTLHPVCACGDTPYRDGWRDGSWDGVDGEFADPAPWYFRTLESWIGLLSGKGLQLDDFHEPLDPVAGRPASVIFIATGMSAAMPPAARLT